MCHSLIDMNMSVVIKFQILVATALAMGGGGVMILASILQLSMTAWLWCGVISMIWLITVLNLLILSYVQSFHAVLQHSLFSVVGHPEPTSTQKGGSLRWLVLKWIVMILGGLAWSVYGSGGGLIIALLLGLVTGLAIFVSSILYGAKHQPML